MLLILVLILILLLKCETLWIFFKQVKMNYFYGLSTIRYPFKLFRHNFKNLAALNPLTTFGFYTFRDLSVYMDRIYNSFRDLSVNKDIIYILYRVKKDSFHLLHTSRGTYLPFHSASNVLNTNTNTRKNGFAIFKSS